MGTMTATFGGLIRDVVCTETPLLLRKEIYATAAGAGAAVLVGAEALALPSPVAVAAGVVASFAIRAVALVFGLSLPTYHARPGRDYDPEGSSPVPTPEPAHPAGPVRE